MGSFNDSVTSKASCPVLPLISLNCYFISAEDTLDAKREKLSKWIQERRMVEDGLRLEIRQRDGRIASLTDGTKELESTQKQLRDQLHSLEERLRNE